MGSKWSTPEGTHTQILNFKITVFKSVESALKKLIEINYPPENWEVFREQLGRVQSIFINTEWVPKWQKYLVWLTKKLKKKIETGVGKGLQGTIDSNILKLYYKEVAILIHDEIY